MKASKFPTGLIAVVLATLFTSCSVVEGIFKAGMGFGIFIVVAIIAIIIAVFVKVAGK